MKVFYLKHYFSVAPNLFKELFTIWKKETVLAVDWIVLRAPFERVCAWRTRLRWESRPHAVEYVKRPRATLLKGTICGGNFQIIAGKFLSCRLVVLFFSFLFTPSEKATKANFMWWLRRTLPYYLWFHFAFSLCRWQKTDKHEETGDSWGIWCRPPELSASQPALAHQI